MEVFHCLGYSVKNYYRWQKKTLRDISSIKNAQLGVIRNYPGLEKNTENSFTDCCTILKQFLNICGAHDLRSKPRWVLRDSVRIEIDYGRLNTLPYNLHDSSLAVTLSLLGCLHCFL